MACCPRDRNNDGNCDQHPVLSEEVVKGRLAHIESVMKLRGIHGNPRHWVVLHGWNRIIDHDRGYELVIPEVPAAPEVGTRLWAIERSDQPDLVECVVVEVRSPNLWVKYARKDIHFLVAPEDCRMLPIPFRPYAVRRADLHDWIGAAAANELINNRQARLRP